MLLELEQQDIQQPDLTRQSSFGPSSNAAKQKLNQSASIDSKKEKTTEEKLAQIFEGKLTTQINFNGKEGKPEQKVGTDTFSDILLNVSSGKDFYAVWDSEYTNIIENFALEDNVFVRAEKIDWIQELPSVLTFQMNRLKFEQGKVKKMLHDVKVDKVIYPDRFMIQNQIEV